jgi:hypothetical protein
MILLLSVPSDPVIATRQAADPHPHLISTQFQNLTSSHFVRAAMPDASDSCHKSDPS